MTEVERVQVPISDLQDCQYALSEPDVRTTTLEEYDDNLIDDILTLISSEYSPSDLQPFVNDTDIETHLHITSTSNQMCHDDTLSVLEDCRLMVDQRVTQLDGQLQMRVNGVDLETYEVTEAKSTGVEIQGPVLTFDDNSLTIPITSQHLFGFDTIDNDTLTAAFNQEQSLTDQEKLLFEGSLWDGTEFMDDRDIGVETSKTTQCPTQRRHPRGHKLTASEAQERKRLLNRQAAKRCRDKKLQEEKDLEKKVKFLRYQRKILQQVHQQLVESWAAGK